MSKSNRFLGPTLAAVVLAAALAGCGSSYGSSTAAKAKHTSKPGAAQRVLSGHVPIAISNYAFKPANLTVKAGTKITFTNHDQTAHTATADGSQFDTGTVKAGQSKTIAVSKTGTYPYHCAFHAFMTGKLTVVG